MRLLYITLLILYINRVNNTSLRKEIRLFLQRSLSEDKEDHKPSVARKALQNILKQQQDVTDVKKAKQKANILKNVREKAHYVDNGRDIGLPMTTPKSEKQIYQIDPILNQMRRSGRNHLTDTSSSVDSSSLELKDWKEEFNEQWVQKKFEAVNSTDTRGDVVNMLAARPSGVPCGDSNQYDVPWGTCVLPMECDAEYRIYRGDYLCGNTQYVCCSLLISAYDMNQGFDVSFEDSSLITDSEEKKKRDRSSRESKKRKKKRDRRKRQRERRKRKRQIKKNIRKIIHEMKKMLHRSYRNSTSHRKKRTKLLKKFIKDLKKQYINDRKAVRDVHWGDMIKIDDALKERLRVIREMNKNFIMNATFRDIVLKGEMTKTGARMLVEAYPELNDAMLGKLRRSGGGLADPGNTNKNGDYLEYDIEYGTLYY